MRVKIGDLVKNIQVDCLHDYGLGLVVSQLEQNPFIDYKQYDDDGRRWAVLWTNPMWTMDNGCSVQYESELEVISEISKG
tara:strand:- start:613 stop:852 length:240 start_codon:yes stop_codon:yes gene_type:complete